jgi:Pyridoxamine 5'-phosphate oxidase
MGKLYDSIDGRLRQFVLDQPVFFVATAPTAVDGHVNLSPKGMRGSLAVLGERRVAYLDHVASGAETIAHLRDNGRIVLMFCAFDGPPKTVRLHGTGRVVLPDDPAFCGLLAEFGAEPDKAWRAVIDVEVTRISDSCGFSVPRMTYVEDRDILLRHNDRKSVEQLEEYRAARNAVSIDGLPALGS